MCSIPCFVVPTPDLMSNDTNNPPLGTTFNMPSLRGIPTYIYLITKKYGLPENKGVLVSYMEDALNIDIDEQNIGGWYNTMRLVQLLKEYT